MLADAGDVSTADTIPALDDAAAAATGSALTPPAPGRSAPSVQPCSDYQAHSVPEPVGQVELAPTRFVESLAQAPRRTFGQWLTRPRRILLTLTAVWVVAVFDLGFTLFEQGSAQFIELNPLAAKLMGGSAAAVMVFKFSLLGVGTLILLGLRRHSVAELACWFLLATKVYLALRWFSYYDCLVRGYLDPLIVAP